MTKLTEIERFNNKMKIVPSGCWEWQGYLTDGYGRIKIKGKFMLAHRYSYDYFVKDIPAGLQLDHLCRNRACVNPDHLEPVTNHENLLRGNLAETNRARQLAKTHCPKGHEYTELNTYIHKTRGSRHCRRCRADARLRSYHEAKTR